MKKNRITLLLWLATLLGLSAQQDAQYTQYMYNTLAVNPAYAGSRGLLGISALHRSQWVGLDGAPTTQTLNVNGPVSQRVGIGLSIVNDEIGNGTNQDTYFDAAFSYTVRMSNTAKLAFGLKAGGHLLNIDFNKLQTYRPSMTAGLVNIDQKFSPNFGAGVYYHTDLFYLGLSVPNFLETEHFDTAGSSSSLLATERMNLYLIGGYVFDISRKTKFKPTVLFKASRGAPLQADFSANFMFNQGLTLGLAYRWDAAISALAAFNITDHLLLGLAYDKETTELGNAAFNNGSFELFLRYEFFTKYRKMKSPRFF